VISALSKPSGIDAHCAGNALMASRAIAAAMYINNQNLFARV
jgi:hypothetical protein